MIAQNTIIIKETFAHINPKTALNSTCMLSCIYQTATSSEVANLGWSFLCRVLCFHAQVKMNMATQNLWQCEALAYLNGQETIYELGRSHSWKAIIEMDLCFLLLHFTINGRPVQGIKSTFFFKEICYGTWRQRN